MTIAIGNDHAGTEYKFEIIKHLEEKGHKVLNFGTDSNGSMDYPDAIHPTADAVESGKAALGVILCGSGNGAQMTANKHQGIRAALCWNKELVELTRQHNNANILTIPARFVSLQQAIGFVDVFLNTEFEGGRHQNRVDKISCAG
ncbi:ribose 5-phosphate isomerase B [Polaribacter aestuariivivens]|uniref:Ribose 5-phosphate isomerase B n=1 Tax=Polaribacter aestuariivivens TaxID=2304626 RepID=A0A5S3N776_9FLAO|nr:ribose 5-phosphate isomerase B [Polaribacter aestuariivivens]TMM30384.1 ribose 5-phosphate isomerase B [Polaribacter aestuariivivens]